MRILILSPLSLTACQVPDEGSPTDSDTASTDTDTDSTDTDTSGPGPAGLERYCQRYKECGGLYYETADDCVDASLDFWGSCPEQQSALNDFGDCMEHVPCEDYDPDTYDPAQTSCSDEWTVVTETSC